jgi:Family of unknown function (DUF6308)
VIQALQSATDHGQSAAHLGAVGAGKLLARKRPTLIPIEDSQIARVFRRKAPDRDERWWDDVRTAVLDTQLTAHGTTLWGYLAHLRDEAGPDHLPILRILDIIGWMHARRSPGAQALTERPETQASVR